jgi:hypothetical protein
LERGFERLVFACNGPEKRIPMEVNIVNIFIIKTSYGVVDIN